MATLIDIYMGAIKDAPAMRGVNFESERDDTERQLSNLVGNVPPERRVEKAGAILDHLRAQAGGGLELENVTTTTTSDAGDRKVCVTIGGDISVEGHRGARVSLTVQSIEGLSVPSAHYGIIIGALDTGETVEVVNLVADGWGDFDYRYSHIEFSPVSNIPARNMVAAFLDIDGYVKARLDAEDYEQMVKFSDYGNMRRITAAGEIAGTYPEAENYRTVEAMFEALLPSYNRKNFRRKFAEQGGWFTMALVKQAHERGVPYDNVLHAISHPVRSSAGWNLGGQDGSLDDQLCIIAGLSDKSFRKLLKLIGDEPSTYDPFRPAFEAAIGMMTRKVKGGPGDLREELTSVAAELFQDIEFTNLTQALDRFDSAYRAFDSAYDEVVNREAMMREVTTDTPFAKAFANLPDSIEVNGGTYLLRPARVAGDLKRWGKRMKNCLGGYSDAARTGERGYLAIYEGHEVGEDGPELDKLLGNIEFMRKNLSYSSIQGITVSQAYGEYNNHIDSDVMDAVIHEMMGACMAERIALG